MILVNWKRGYGCMSIAPTLVKHLTKRFRNAAYTTLMLEGILVMLPL
jgi:hypothetical protein